MSLNGLLLRPLRLAGDTSKFAIKISFADDPDEGVGVTPDESVSWGSFQIWAGGKNLTTHQHSGETLDSIHWYLLPLLEWWTENWDPLFHEEKLPTSNAAAVGEAALRLTRETPRLLPDDDALEWEQNWYAWWRRHVTDAARFGGVFPSVCFRRWRHEVDISWDNDAVSFRPSGVEFVQSSGTYRTAPEQITSPLFEVLTTEDTPVDVEQLSRDLGVTIGEITLNDASIRGIAIGGPSYKSTILLNRNNPANQYPTGRRFSIAHELSHLLYDRAFAQDLAFASGQWAPRDVEKRANAFAAMLLMPTDRVPSTRERARPARRSPWSPAVLREKLASEMS